MVNISPALWEQLKKVPALPPPPGVTPNLANRQVPNYFEWVITATLGFTFTTVLILIRIYTKFFIIKSHGWEDYTSVLAWIGFIAYVTYDVQCFKAGAGVHQWNIPVTEIGASAKVAMIKQIINCPIIYITKLSILLQFNRLFAPHKLGKAYWIIQAVIWINTAYYLAGMLAIIFECTPRSKAWDVFTPGGSCVDIATLIVVGSVINLVSDLVMLFIPLFCISSLKLPLRKKIGVSCVFATGAFACVTSIMRTVTSVHLVGEQDLSFAYFPVLLWADAELASGIVCGCMPALVPFINHFGPEIQRSLSFFPSSLRSYFSSYSYYYNRRSGSGSGGGGVIGTATASSVVTTGPSSLPGAGAGVGADRDRKSSNNTRQSWARNKNIKAKAKSDYLELTAFSSSNTVTTITDDNEKDNGRVVQIKDLESGLQRFTNKCMPAQQDVDSRLQQWNPPVSVRNAVIESKKSPNKHVESGLQWNPGVSSALVRYPEIEFSPRPAMTGRQSQPPSQSVSNSQSKSQSQWSPTPHHVESGLQWNPVSVPARNPHREIEPSLSTAKTSRQSQSQSQSQSPPIHYQVGSGLLQWNAAPPPSPVLFRHPEIELQQPVTRTMTRTTTDHHRRQLPIKHIIDRTLRMHPPQPSEMKSFPSSSPPF